jgi:hypothetical protein
VLTNGDPVVNSVVSIYGPLPEPFAGYSMNCRQCHMVAEDLRSCRQSCGNFKAVPVSKSPIRSNSRNKPKN